MTSNLGGLFGVNANMNAPANFWDGNTFVMPGAGQGPSIAPGLFGGGFPSTSSNPMTPAPTGSSPGTGVPSYATPFIPSVSTIGGLFGGTPYSGMNMNPFTLNNLADQASRSQEFIRGLER